MSGQQIGTAVGFVAGFFLPGGPQVWAAIGGFIGGVIDPTEIKGPHIGDGPQQSSNEGVPIALILGTAGWVQGNIAQISVRREVKKEDDGKGGPVVVTYEAHQDFCVMAAESDDQRGSTIVGVLMVRVNGNIVYDMRSGANMGAENAKFLQHHKFYYGHEDQMPDPTMEAVSGVGNTPAYRGVFTMVARDLNLTEYGGAIPTYEFVLVGEGEEITETTTAFAPPGYGRFVNSDFPLANPESSYKFIGVRVPISGPSTDFEADTISEIIDHFSTGLASYGGAPSVYVGYSASSPPDNTAGNPQSTGDFGINRATAQPDVTEAATLILCYQNHIPVDYVDTFVTSGGTCALVPLQSDTQNLYCDRNGTAFGKFDRDAGGDGPPGLVDYTDCGGGGFGTVISGIPALYITVTSRRSPPIAASGDPCMLGYPVLLPDDPTHIIDCDGNVAPVPEYDEVTDFNLIALQNQYEETIDGQRIYVRRTVGPVIESTDPDNTEAFWDAAYAAAVANGDIEDGLTWPADYPVSSPNNFEATYSVTSLHADELLVSTAIERLAIRGGLAAEDLDTSDIIDTLKGYAIQADYNSADCIKPLLAYSSSFASEYDGLLYFHPYGGEIEITIDPEDFIEGSDVTDDGSREQAKEYPRKLSVNSIDITQNYTVRPQYAYRSTPDVRAIGEETIQVPLCDTPDHTAKIAEIAIKVSYARLQGTRQFAVPYVGYDTYLKIVAGMPFALDGKRWVANRVTLEDGLLQIDASYDRQSAYTSIATGVPAPPPTPPVSTIGGVTLFTVMNLPALRDQDDKVLLYFGVAGILNSWRGCLLQWSIDDGASWQTAIASMTESSVMGYLTAALPDASAYGDDVTNTLSVSVHGGELNSITYEQYLNEMNPCALVNADCTAEVIQFVEADEISTGRYNLSTLGRGRLGTTTSEHAQGSRFCSLDSVYSMEIPSSQIGRTIKFRPVTFGTVPENNAIYEIVFSPAVSQTEYPPAFVEHEFVGDLLNLTVGSAGRFGSDLNPVHSVNMIGFHWDVTDGFNTTNRETVATETTIDTLGWSFPITVQVRQVNRFTGQGPALEVII